MGMYEHYPQPKETPVPLSVAGGQRIVTPGMDPVLGWIGNENSRAAQALVFPYWLLEPRPTETIAYACNLPAPAQRAQLKRSQLAPPGSAGSGADAQFQAASLPGGRVAIITAGGKPGAMAFRWACVSSSESSGAVWRCFMRLYSPSAVSPWTPVAYDYVFEPAGGFLVNTPGSLRVTLGGSSFKLTHPDGGPSCFPSHSGLVKVTHASADGWAKRELQSLWLCPDRAVVARFADGTSARIATAAPAHSAILAA
jgi:hypothetical protein